MAYLQSGGNSDSFNTTVGVTLTGVTAGSVIIAAWVTSSSQPTGISSTGGGTFGNTTTGTGGNGFLVGSSLLLNAAAGSHTVSITVASSQSLRLAVAEYGSLTTFDVASAIANGFSSSAASASQAPSAAGKTAIAIVHVADPGITLSSWLSSMTEDVEVAVNNHLFGFASLASAGAGSINAGATLSSSGGWGAWIQFLSGAPSGNPWYAYAQMRG